MPGLRDERVLYAGYGPDATANSVPNEPRRIGYGGSPVRAVGPSLYGPLPGAGQEIPPRGTYYAGYGSGATANASPNPSARIEYRPNYPVGPSAYSPGGGGGQTFEAPPGRTYYAGYGPDATANPAPNETRQIGYKQPWDGKTIKDPGPGNPNVGKPWDPAKAAVPAANTAEAPGVLSRVGGALRTGGKWLGGLGGAAAGAVELGTGIYEKDPAKMGLGAADLAAVGALATGVGTAPAAAYIAGRTTHGLASMIPKDTLGGAMNQFAQMWGGGVNDDALQTDRAAQRMGVASPVTGALPAAPGNAAPGAGPGIPSRPDGQPTPQQIEQAVRKYPYDRQGNSFTSPGGEHLQGPGVSTISGGAEGMERNLRAAEILRSMNQQAAPGPQAFVMGEGGGAGLRDAGYLTARDARVGKSDKPMGRAQRAMAEMEQQERIAKMHNTTALRGQDLNFDSSMYGHNIQARGQDLTYGSAIRGQDMTARTAANAARIDQFNKNRDYDLNVAKFNNDLGKQGFEQHREAENQLQRNLESRFRVDDGKGGTMPDTNKIASYRADIDTTIPAFIKSLERIGSAEAKAKADDLRKRGPGALEPTDHDRLQRLFERKERMAQARGIGPNKATYSESGNLLDYEQTGVEERTFGGNRIVTPAGSISYNDLRYTEPANAILPDWLKVENRNLTRGIRKE